MQCLGSTRHPRRVIRCSKRDPYGTFVHSRPASVVVRGGIRRGIIRRGAGVRLGRIIVDAAEGILAIDQHGTITAFCVAGQIGIRQPVLGTGGRAGCEGEGEEGRNEEFGHCDWKVWTLDICMWMIQVHLGRGSLHL